MSRMSAADLLKLPRGAEALGLVTAPTQEPRRGVMGKWEAAFLREVLEPARFPWIRFEPITLTLYDGSSDVRKARYTPDFLAIGLDGFIQAFEVKGQRRQAGIVRIKAAAQQYPWIHFRLATGGPGRWVVQKL